MVAMKQKTGSQTTMLATIAVSVAVVFSSLSFYYSTVGNCGEAAGGMSSFGAQESAFLAASLVRSATSLSAKESYGWFDDIPDEGWRYMKLRAQTAVQYMNPWKPQTGYENPIMWYLDNLQVSRLFGFDHRSC